MEETLIIVESALEAVLNDHWRRALDKETLAKVEAALRQVQEERREKRGD